MLDGKGFDAYAGEYDGDVRDCERKGDYPFAGYTEVLNCVFDKVNGGKGTRILDLGFGTAVLTKRLYDAGCEIWGQDFSRRMIEIAGEKMPKAHLFFGDFAAGLDPALLANRYDAVVITYAMHHLNDEEKAALIDRLLPLLKENGNLVIGDISFSSEAQQTACRERYAADWDGEEIYLVAEEMKKRYPRAVYEDLSHCGGVLTIPG